MHQRAEPGEWSAGTIPALWSDPPGVPGVACRRGTCGCPGIVSEPGAEVSVYRRRAANPVWIAPANHEHSPIAGEYRGAQRPDPAGSCSPVDASVLSPPAFVGRPQRPRPSAVGHPPQRVCGRRRSRPTPCAQPSTTAQGEERSLRAIARRSRGFAALRQNRGEPPAPPSFGKRRCSSIAFAGGVGARGRAARPTNAGGNCEHLQEFAGAE